MNIVILGWGSLLWDKNINFDETHKEWLFDGPSLPLEFSRVSESRGGALTLVIDTQNGTKCQVAYSLSIRKTLRDAINDLTKREGTSTKRIGFVDVLSGSISDDEISLGIKSWAKEHDIEAVVWTNLQSNFWDKVGEKFSVESAATYLTSLAEESKIEALKYIKSAPEFVQTPLRKEFEIRLATNEFGEK